LLFRYCSLLFCRFSLLFGAPTEPPCEQGQDGHSRECNISDPRHGRSFALRLFGLTQGRLALGLRGSHRLKLLALCARSRLSLLFTRADEVEVQGCWLRRSLGPSRRPGLCCLGNIVA